MEKIEITEKTKREAKKHARNEYKGYSYIHGSKNPNGTFTAVFCK